MYNFKRFALLSLILVLALSLAGGVLAQEEGEKVIVMDSGPTDVPTIDPALSSDTQSNDIVEHVFVSLTRVNEVTAEVEPGFATSWEVDEESKTYTFNLLQEVPWVRFNPEAGEVEQVLDDEGNVRYVTAQDFVYGWQRTLNPETASDYAYVPAPWVVGGAEFNAGEADADALAVTAVDDYTLQINATEVTGFVPLIYGLWMVGAQPQWTIEANGDAWTEVGNYHTFGPFTVSEWLRDESITMVKNPYWPGSEYVPQASIDKIVQLIIDESAALDSYEAGNLNYVSSVSSAALPRIQTDPVLSQQLNIGTDFCSYYYGFNVTKEPLDNVHLRRALSYAVDRQSIVDNVTQGGQVPGQWFSRPGLVAAPTLESHPDLGMYYDPALAQEELALALADLGLESADELPAITLMHNVSEGHARIAQAIQQMWTDELGVPVQIATQEWAVYLDLLDEDPPQIFRLGWCMDYPDAHNFLADVFREDSDNNHTLWGNAEYEALLDEAMLLADPEARQELYAAAEDILVYEDAAIIPIYWYTTVQINKPELERTFSIIGQERYEKWDIAQ